MLPENISSSRKNSRLGCPDCLRQMFRTLQSDRLLHRQLLLLAIAALFLGLCYVLFGRACIVQLLFGLPCPGCGLLHAALFLFGGHFKQAMASNPCIVLWIPFLVFLIACRLRGQMHSKILTAALTICALATIALYLWRMAAVFPAWPMDCYEHSLMHMLLNLVGHSQL